MEIKVVRKNLEKGYTIGELVINDVVICDTLEPMDRGLTSLSSSTEIRWAKALGVTAIPTGTYHVEMRWSKNFKAWRPFLIDVHGFNGIMIHEGNTAKDTHGCILVGMNTKKNMVLNSRVQLKRILSIINHAVKHSETITLTVLRE